MSQTVRFERQDNITIVTIDRPEALNALNGDVITELEQVVTALENDRDIRCMILTGAGRAFVAGADIGAQYPLDLDEPAGQRPVPPHRKAGVPHHRRGQRLRPRRRLRAGPQLRHHPGLRKGQVRPA